MSNNNIKPIRRFMPFIFTAIVLIIDILTKALVVWHYQPEGSFRYVPVSDMIKLIGDWLRVGLIYNNNIIFGFGDFIPEAVKPFILIGSGLIAFGLIIFIFTKIKQDRLFPRLCFGLMMGGALGNLFDRIFGWIIYKGEWKLIFEKGVVDWIDFGIPKGMFGLENGWRWYTFNIADSSLIIGIILLILYMIVKRNDEFFKVKEKARK